MSAGKSNPDKPPRIKGLVKRCRSFKEDIISRLARNKSIGGKEDTPGSPRRIYSCASEGTSPTPGGGASDSSPTTTGGSHSPQVTISHRLKEAYLTLQFVESLIRKDCIDLIGGSSNVMLDLMGGLLGDVRKSAASDSPAYQSVISQIKLVLSEFLVSVDVLLLKNRYDQSQRQLSYDKLLETLKNVRAALDKLNGLVNSKENGHLQCGFNSSSSLLSSSSPRNLKSPSSTSRLDSMTFDTGNNFIPPPASASTELRKPPLPPKLKQWAGKSFDMAMEFQPPINFMNQGSGSLLISDWFEKSSIATGNSNHYGSQPHFTIQPAQSVTIVKDVGIDDSAEEKWTDSAVYLSGSSKNSRHSAGGQSQGFDDLGFTSERIRKLRTMSDSIFSGARRESEESLDRILVPEDELEGTSQTTSRSHCSQSLSLGSSLDNLLLVDVQSQHSGLSPNSGNRPSTSSTNNQSASPHSPASRSGLALAGLSNYDPDLDGDVFCSTTADDNKPPELPKKTQKFIFGPIPVTNGSKERCPSPYDNVEDEQDELATWHAEAQSRISAFQLQQRQFMSYSESRATLVGNNGKETPDERPPLPPKKKHSITAYVELLHNFDVTSHHHHFHNHKSSMSSAAAYQSHFSMRNRGGYGPPGTSSSITLYNPQLPGIPGSACQSTNSRASYSHTMSTSYHHFSSFSSTATYAAPVTASDEDILGSCSGDLKITDEATSPYRPIINSNSIESPPAECCSPTRSNSNSSLNHALSSNQPPALPPKKSSLISKTPEQTEDASSCGPSFPAASRNMSASISSPTRSLPIGITSDVGGGGGTPESPSVQTNAGGVSDKDNPDLYLLDVSNRLVANESQNMTSSGKTGGTDGPEVKGGDPHILMVYAASPDLTDLKFREVFLLTYRTFLRPIDLVTLLWKRFEYFEKRVDRISMMHRRATLEIFVDVVCSLTPMDMEQDTILKVRNCIYHLVNSGEIHSALKSRKGLLDKYDARIKLLMPKPAPATLAVTTEPQSLLHWSATCIAQQMTLLDADLFRQLLPAELLLWAREQQEDFCPALNEFTDHFNKVSYWARSKVLLCPNARERNRTMKKLIEVMRKLREYNNFNSLLAVLAALDSAPIRRLGFSRRLTEALKPHAALTDSSGSFRTYRQALAESKPSCIPYIGLVLQDLTFVHIGNADLIPDGKVNWIKRWQQWLVLEPIRRFHACHYGFLRNDVLLTFLNNFDESLNDDDLWAMSENIKPRGKS